MKTLIFILSLFAFISCSEPEVTPDPNVVFYTSYTTFRISINNVFADREISIDHQYKEPDCNTFYEYGSKYLILHMKAGVYDVKICDSNGRGIETKAITVHENSCNKFNVQKYLIWE